jgi:hypothetical protein
MTVKSAGTRPIESNRQRGGKWGTGHTGPDRQGSWHTRPNV